LRPSRQRQDFFCGDPDNIILMSPVLHKAFDGCSGLASVIIEPIDVVPPSGGEPHGVVVMRLYLQDSNLLNVVHFRPEVTFEDGSTDGGQVLTLALSDPSPARFAAFLLYKSEYERSRAHASTVASAWSPPTSVPASTEGLRKLLTPAGFQVYLQLQGRRTDTKVDGTEVEVDIMGATTKTALREVSSKVLQDFLASVGSRTDGVKQVLVERILHLQALAAGGGGGGGVAGTGAGTGAGGDGAGVGADGDAADDAGGGTADHTEGL